MTTGTLGTIIGVAIIGQIVLALSLALWRRRREVSPNPLNGPAPSAPQHQAGPPAAISGQPAWEGFKPFRVARRVVENATGDIVSFHLEPESPMSLPPFRPGQFLTFRFELPDADGHGLEPVIRCYSLSDRPQADHYRISVKRTPGGRVSNHLHDQVREGDRLMVKAPSGHFHLIEEPPRPLVLIAGGIGVTPMLSMLTTRLEQPEEGPEIWLFYGVRNGREVIMSSQLRALSEYHPKFHLRLCYSRPQADERLGIDYHCAGHVDSALLQRELQLGRYRFYVCGPSAMMESLVPGIEALGVPPEDIHYEAFGPSTLKRTKRPAATGIASTQEIWQVSFGRSGRSAEWNGRHDSLLDLIEAEGIPVDSVCRSGSCGSCQTRIEAGEVTYDQAPDAEVEAGHCLLCVGRPASDLRLAL